MESIIHNSAYDSQYQKLLTSVIEQAKATRFRTSVGVNQQLIRLYWFIGEEISRLKIDTKWGSKFFVQLSHDLMAAFPDMKGFSTRNLQYIKQMYDTFSSITITPQVVAQIGLEDNISRFLIELGAGFAYVGRQIRLEINGDEFFCDLLFYHLRLRRYIVVELKTGKFEPEYVSKLNLYCTAVDHLFKTDLDGDTIGLLFCKEKNDLVAQWTVEKNEQPIAITRYELKKLLPK